MDYSLLLMVEQKDETIGQIKETRNKIVGETAIYHVGIIDYLTDWNYHKKAEHYYRSWIL